MTAKTKKLYAYRPIGKSSPLIAHSDMAVAKQITKAWFINCGYEHKEQIDELFSWWELITLTVEEDD